MTLEEWECLPLVGFVTDQRVRVLETRMCSCNSSLSRVIALPASILAGVAR